LILIHFNTITYQKRTKKEKLKYPNDFHSVLFKDDQRRSVVHNELYFYKRNINVLLSIFVIYDINQ